MEFYVILNPHLRHNAYSTAYSIEIDDVSKTLYYVDETLDAIVVTSLEENARKHTLAVNDIHDVHKMTMSLSRRKIYWSDKGQHRRGVRVGRIEHMDLAGGGREVLVDNINSPHSLAISEPDNTLFWTSHVTIGWKNLNNGNQGQYKLPNSVNSIIDVSCYSQHMFIARLNEPSLKTILISDVINNVTHDNLNVFGKSLFYKVTALMLFVNKSLNADPTDCSVNNGGCPHICLPGTSRPHCVCADHYDIIPANNTCVMRHNATGDITPPDFGSSCPSEYFLVYLDECSNTGSFNISTPQANDDSGSVVVRAGQTHPPPYRLTLGFHRFSYKAQDLSGNTAYCQFYVTVLEQRCYRPPHIPTHGSPSPPSCGSQYGSVINVTCAGSNHTTFQIRCAFTGRWVATGAAECPPFIPPPPTTTTEPTPRLQTTTTTTPTNAQTTNIATTSQTTPPPIAGTNNGGPTPTTIRLTNQPTQDSANQARGIPGPEKLQDGFIVLIVLVIVVVIIVALLLVRRYMKVSWPLREAKFRSSDESVMLANEDML
uniref:uncharacterized protein LOC101243411 isoform X1 n=1 Tax=Ciona intestinalis TaxID=7719 RepID=UPI000EF49982|nr:uncharacterized protein LOC101243411 isoform X1 [Ciona intestinalis]XP_026696219.1 uncharacterized protein LOC101243411 isoform X2 [Ciona intestinalis]|eukprot:XP_026696218.1 uncharacterized protein LOC101243411 isoform X1 [Ciona intestinalis]